MRFNFFAAPLKPCPKGSSKPSITVSTAVSLGGKKKLHWTASTRIPVKWSPLASGIDMTIEQWNKLKAFQPSQFFLDFITRWLLWQRRRRRAGGEPVGGDEREAGEPSLSPPRSAHAGDSPRIYRWVQPAALFFLFFFVSLLHFCSLFSDAAI